VFLHCQEIIGNIPIVKLRPLDLRHTGGGVLDYSRLLPLLLPLIDRSSPPFFLNLVAGIATLPFSLYFSATHATFCCYIKVFCGSTASKRRW
jgi:hypothetical protein